MESQIPRLEISTCRTYDWVSPGDFGGGQGGQEGMGQVEPSGISTPCGDLTIETVPYNSINWFVQSILKIKVRFVNVNHKYLKAEYWKILQMYKPRQRHPTSLTYICAPSVTEALAKACHGKGHQNSPQICHLKAPDWIEMPSLIQLPQPVLLKN